MRERETKDRMERDGGRALNGEAGPTPEDAGAADAGAGVPNGAGEASGGVAGVSGARAETSAGVPGGGAGVSSGNAAAPAGEGGVPEGDAVVLGRSRMHELRALLARYIRRHLPPLPKPQPTSAEPPRAEGPYARLLPVLQLIPWLLGILFAVSFLWDFPGVELSVGGASLALDGILRFVSVSGLIGFLTNWLAITMLFNPRERRPIFGQGLIPAQRERVIFRLARAISEELINEKIIKAKIEESGIIGKYRDVTLTVTRGVVEDPDFRRELKVFAADYVESILASQEVHDRIVGFVEAKIQALAGTGWAGVVLRAYRFWNEDDFRRRLEGAVRELPASLDNVLDQIDHVLDRVPEKIEARSEDIEAWVTRIVLGFVEQLDVYDMIISNMEQYDERKLEALIKNTSNEQLNYIKYLGGVLGALGGLVIWRPLLALCAFVVVGGTLWVIDEALFRRRRAAGSP